MLKVSIVTPCFNMEDYIGATVRSVTSQEFENLEYLIVDGMSTDRTLSIVERYKDQCTTTISERDDGQYHAIQKGLESSSGDIMGWLNADDLYMPWTLRVINDVFTRFPNVDWIIGLPSFLNARGSCTSIHSEVAAYPRKFIENGWYRDDLGGYLQQESMFWRRSLWDKVGGLDLSLKLAADFKLWTEFARFADLVPVNVPLAAFRSRPGEQRSSLQKANYEEEVKSVCKKLKVAPALWQLVARQGIVARSLCRQFIRRKSECVAYSQKSENWEIIKSIRPVSRISLRRLFIERKLSKVG